MLQSIKGDTLVTFLSKRCSLTMTQLDTLLASRASERLKEQIRYRDRAKISKGSFLRTLRQSQENIEACVYTVILLQYLGALAPDVFEGLTRTGRLMSKLRESSPSNDEIMRFVQSLEEYAHTISGRRKLHL